MSMRLLLHISIPKSLQLYSTLFGHLDMICTYYKYRLKSLHPNIFYLLRNLCCRKNNCLFRYDNLLYGYRHSQERWILVLANYQKTLNSYQMEILKLY